MYYPPISLDTGVADTSLTADTSFADNTTTPVASSSFDSTTSDFSSGSTVPSDLAATTPDDSTTTTTPPADTDHQQVADADRPRVANLAPASDRSRPGHTGGTAGWLTLVALAAVIVLAGADQFVMRRSRRKFST
jgi:hypothetical protein